ncbi:MAG: hypothetical protein CVU65_10825 [Deltaproteobacteria bacterium HGW-Deltaproteobacteria-22]|jgi:hypothetical protein|nr:MAG: hypothetical protein CVU65_10825 [Deltaproteobacteria bacterium HGW-Deltaproteobacteria-22]
MLLFSALVLLVACDNEANPKEGCGNGLLDLGEACDGTAGDTPDCMTLGYYQQIGPVTCNGDCQWDLSVCAQRCGDGIIQAAYGEDCDAENLAGNTCLSLALGGGTLSCSQNCRFDTTGCEAMFVCGDGVISSPTEQCEGADLDGETCESQGFSSGTLSCDTECRFDTTGCI